MAWVDVDLEPVPLAGPFITRFREAIQASHANGGILLAAFGARNPEVFTHAEMHDLQGPFHPYKIFLKSPKVRAHLPELKLEDSDKKEPVFLWKRPFEMEGSLTHTLINGGAYCAHPAMAENAARELTRGFVRELVSDPIAAMSVVAIDGYWTGWFHDVAWDETFILRDLNLKRFVILCITDTD